jgi:hypothetical protein
MFSPQSLLQRQELLTWSIEPVLSLLKEVIINIPATFGEKYSLDEC